MSDDLQTVAKLRRAPRLVSPRSNAPLEAPRVATAIPPIARLGSGSRPPLKRLAMLSLHTSPVEQPGVGDAGGMNVYIMELSRRLAAQGVEVEVFTRATSGDVPPIEYIEPGFIVRNVVAGPLEPLPKADLPSQLCAFTAAVLRAEAAREPGWYDLIHSHYWLSGQVGWLAKERWGVPLVHSMHTLARVKNAALAEGDAPEPSARAIGEAQVVEAADRLIANTAAEARQLIDLYDADPAVSFRRPARCRPCSVSARIADRCPCPTGSTREPRRAALCRADPAAQGARPVDPRARRDDRSNAVVARSADGRDRRRGQRLRGRRARPLDPPRRATRSRRLGALRAPCRG